MQPAGRSVKEAKFRVTSWRKRFLAACKRIGQQEQGVIGYILEGNAVQRAAIEQVEIGEPVLQRRGELLWRALLCCGKEGVQIACMPAVVQPQDEEALHDAGIAAQGV